MDTSAEYIKMCEKAVEIREEWERGAGDFCASRYDKRIMIVGFNCNFSQPVEENYTWLPRQDQLQGMISEAWGNSQWYKVMEAFADWFIGSMDDTHIKSAEQAWLAFFMLVEYEKQWTGSEWIDT